MRLTALSLRPSAVSALCGSMEALPNLASLKLASTSCSHLLRSATLTSLTIGSHNVRSRPPFCMEKRLGPSLLLLYSFHQERSFAYSVGAAQEICLQRGARCQMVMYGADKKRRDCLRKYAMCRAWGFYQTRLSLLGASLR